jgi:C6 transcription factor Pro1
MNGGEEERAVSNSFKEIVKHTSRRKATIRASNGETVRIAPKPVCWHEQPFPSGSGQEPQSGSQTEDMMLQSPKTDSAFSISADESVLLMHFLDNVFPLQYPMYKPEIERAGRGWLLALLLRTKHLYHVAQAFSTYHLRTSNLVGMDESSRIQALVRQEKHLEICLQQASHLAQTTSLKVGQGFLITVTQLLFFEVRISPSKLIACVPTSTQLFNGHTETWQAHLRAAVNMYQRIHDRNFAEFGTDDISSTTSGDGLPPLGFEAVAANEVIRFLGGTVLWFDVVSSITSGTAPSLFADYLNGIISVANIKLEFIFGCRNWVIFQIGRIAGLHEQKAQALQQVPFGCPPLQQTVDDIKREILSARSWVNLDGSNPTECDPARPLDAMSNPVTLITQVFISTSLIYLHLVVSGYSYLVEIDETISQTLRLLQKEIQDDLLPALILPLFIIGSAVDKDHLQYFRNIFSSPPILTPSLKHRERVLPILEEIWGLRESTPDLAWKDCIRLTKDILLI